METGTMTTIMADVEGFVATRCWRQLMLRRPWIGHIVAGRKQDILVYLIIGGLCIKRSNEQRYDSRQ